MQPDDAVKVRPDIAGISIRGGVGVAGLAGPGPLDTRGLAAIEAKLDEARREYHRGNYNDALRILREVTTRLEGSTDSMSDKAAGSALLASAYTVLGRVLPTLNLGDQTTPQLLARAAQMFERLGSSAVARRYYSEYGIALRLLGQKDRAIAVLKQAAEDGSATPEALRDLGSLLNEQGEVTAAAEFLQMAAAATPTDPGVRVALAEVLERAGRPLEAAEVYREAGWILLGYDQLEAAVMLLDRALRLQPDDPYTLVLVAQGAYQQGEAEKGSRALERALAVVPGYYPALLVKAWHLMHVGDLTAALEVAREADAADPQQVAPKTIMAEILEARGDLPQARACLDAALRLSPDSADLLTRKSRLLYREGAHEEALSLVERALALDPDLMPALMLKGWTLAQLGRLRDAAEVFRQASMIAPSFGEAFAALGEVYWWQGQRGEAMSFTNQALALDPDNARALVTKGRSLLPDQPEEAARALERALQIDGSYTGAWVELAFARELLEDYDGALAAVIEGLKLEPGDLSLVLRRASILRSRGQPTEAIEVLQGLLSAAPNMVAALELKAEICLQREDYDEVLSLTERGLAVQPGSPHLLRLRGLALVYDEHFEQAVETFRELLGIDPGLEADWNWLAEAYRGLQKWEEAEAALAKSLALSRNAFALGTRAQIALAQGRVEDAVKGFDESLELDGSLVWAKAGRGQALSLLGRGEEALRDLNEVLEHDPDNLGALFDKGEVLMDLGKAAEAAELLRPRAADHPLVQTQYARALTYCGRWDEAGDMFEAARSQDNDTWILGYYAQYCCDTGDFLRGAEIAREATQKSVGASAPYGMLGWALQNLGKGRAEEALQAYDEALRAVPDDPTYRKGRADALRGLGRTDDARREYQRVLEGAASGPEASYHHALLGWCRYGLGQYDEAVRLYTLALPRQVDPYPTHFDLALALLASGRHSMADDEYRNTLREAAGVHALRRRGLIYVALYDLIEAQDNREVTVDAEEPVTGQLSRLLRQEFLEAGGQAKALEAIFGSR